MTNIKCKALYKYQYYYYLPIKCELLNLNICDIPNSCLAHLTICGSEIRTRGKEFQRNVAPFVDPILPYKPYTRII